MGVEITGPAFLLQGAGSIVIAVGLYLSDKDVIAPIAGVALMTASVVALAAAYLGVFINTSERVIRAETGLSFGAGIVALLACALIVKQRADVRGTTPLPTPGVDRDDVDVDADVEDASPLVSDREPVNA